MIGVAVGLGNVWRFPYMMGLYGGSAFLVLYLVFVVIFGIPAVMGEWAVGRATRHGPLGAFGKAFSGKGRLIGGVLLINVLLANSYYVVVIAYILYTAGYSVLHGFDESAADNIHVGLSDGWLMYALAMGLILVILVTLYAGLEKGVERVSKLFVPFFGIVVLYMIFHSLTLPGAVGQLGEFLKPDFGVLGATEIFAAMGQAFFSLSLGGTFYVIYGSFLRQEESIPSASILTALGDVSASVLASLFIVPTVLVFGLDLSAGPGLIFETLPHLFSVMPGGRVVGSFFFLALLFVAFLSSLAALQVLYGAFRDSFAMAKMQALLILLVAETFLVLPIVFYPVLIERLDLICGSGMQCVGSGLTLLALTWGLGRKSTQEQLPLKRGFGLLFFWLRWGIPLALLIMLVNYVVEKVSEV